MDLQLNDYDEGMSSTVGPGRSLGVVVVACPWLLAVHGEEMLVVVGVKTGGRDLWWEELVCEQRIWRKRTHGPQVVSSSFCITNFDGAFPSGVVSRPICTESLGKMR